MFYVEACLWGACSAPLNLSGESDTSRSKSSTPTCEQFGCGDVSTAAVAPEPHPLCNEHTSGKVWRKPFPHSGPDEPGEPEGGLVHWMEEVERVVVVVMVVVGCRLSRTRCKPLIFLLSWAEESSGVSWLQCFIVSVSNCKQTHSAFSATSCCTSVIITSAATASILFHVCV